MSSLLFATFCSLCHNRLTKHPLQNFVQIIILDKTMSEQVERQYSNRLYVGKRRLDFSPFEASLKTLSALQIAQLDQKLLTAEVRQVQEMLKAGELTSAQLVLYYLHRIQFYDMDKLNSVLELNPAALEIARERDEARQVQKVVGLLYGIPILLKDNIGTGDKLHNTAGAKVLENSRADQDAFLVKQLRAAGAIILGKTNLSEWANYMTSVSASGFSVLGGQTKNPYGEFDVGGSSSGSASAIAANLAMLTIGSETAGSLVSPASQNSLVTIKPSLGLVSRDRIIPITAAQDTAGPLARTVSDMAILFSAMVGYDTTDPLTEVARKLEGTDFTQFLDKDGLKGLKIGLVESPNPEKFGEAQQKLGQMLVEAGAVVKELALPDATNLRQGDYGLDYLPVLTYGIKHDLAKYFASIGESNLKSLEEVVEFNNKDLANRAPFGQDLLIEAVSSEMTEAEYQARVQTNQQISRQLIEGLLEENEVELIASINNGFTKYYAPAGYPAVAVPMAYRESGEPLGLTLIGRYLDDGKLIKAAYAFEQKHPVRRNPTI